MRILGIETSCDETAAAVVEDGTTILSSVVASSEELHKKTGGIIPENAARKQIEYIIPVINKALENAFPDKDLQSQVSTLDAIAVTYGPGLIGSLLVGVETAKTLSYLWNKPLIPVNHLVAHLYANWLDNSLVYNVADGKYETVDSSPEFPLLGLVISGGHTDLVIMRSHSDIQWIGGTRDDAAGEAFDKTARILGLPYPGGPAISKEAEKYFSLNQKSVNQKLTLFPRPMIKTDDFDWSFSGLKTSVLNYTKSENEIEVERVSAEIQEAIADVLVSKTCKALAKTHTTTLLLGGGVSANTRIREMFLSSLTKCKMKTRFHVPAVKNCTDNAAVIASRAFFDRSVTWQEISANPELSITE